MSAALQDTSSSPMIMPDGFYSQSGGGFEWRRDHSEDWTLVSRIEAWQEAGTMSLAEILAGDVPLAPFDDAFDLPIGRSGTLPQQLPVRAEVLALSDYQKLISAMALQTEQMAALEESSFARTQRMEPMTMF